MSSCRKFQANIFNKSKCQNCFKPRESHLLNDKDSNQAKPISGGWLLLAPEGTDFDNPLHRTRKWQRRFFILYEHGLLHYVLDEMPGTLPQGTINMNQCCDVIDGEMRTGHKNSLCIVTPEKEYFIRAECKDVINGWQEALAVYPSTNKQKKKRKVEPNLQEPGPAKVTVTSSSSGGSAESVPKSRASLWQNESQWSRTTIPQTDSTITTPDDGGTVRTGRKMRVESGYFSLEKTKSEPSSQSAQPQHVTLSSSAPSSSLGAPGPRYKPKTEPPTPPGQPSQDLLPSPGALPQSTITSSQRSETLGATGTKSTWEFSVGERSADTDGGSRVGRCEPHRQTCREAFHTELRPRTCTPGREEVAWLFGEERRLSQILRRFEEGQLVEQKDPSSHSEPSANTTTLIPRQGCSGRRDLLHKHPDLLNFKKGWMTKLYDDGVWKKHWFVLTDQSLRYYKDSVAEEASHLDGEIDLSTCYDVKTFPVQRNYGFQVLCQEGAYTLSAMTSGIRRNWIQAIMKNVQPTVAPDITRSLSDEKIKTQTMLKPCLQVTVEQSLVPEGHRQPPGNQSSVLSPELCKTAACEHKLEGCSETCDCFDLKMEQTEKPVKAQGDTVDLSSTTSSSCPPSSPSSFSSASSPGSTSSFQTSVSVAHPLSTTGRENVRRGIQLHSTCANNVPNTATVTVTSTLNNNVIPLPEIREQGKKEAHHPTSSHHIDEDKDDRPSVVLEEIEQRWHQVETTPLREEKQVPITTVLGTSARLPAHELVVLLDKQLGQKQTELDQLQKQNTILKEKLEDALRRELSAREGYVLQSTCERGFATMEETHQRVIEDLQRHHQREISKLMEERERLLAEETAATIAAIEAMKNAQKEKMEKSQRSHLSGLNSDIDELHLQYEEELQSIQRELDVLSEQYSQKCLENAHLAQALEAERQALRQCQRYNQELNADHQELNNQLTAEITQKRSRVTGETSLSSLTQGKDVYELEVLLRIKESEIQYLKQEIHSLKDELQSALRDKKYATDKYKDIYTELSIVKAKADFDISKLKKKLLTATEALGGRSVDEAMTSGYDIMKSKSNPDFIKKDKAATSKQLRRIRSKTVTAQVSWDS
ncbi:hypothetical protein JOB18_040953 [Solea senegalensis]|uniref:PH domain-containing protein n=1 Tax=Solea senegalensis TaxID=28829 RepID=A0AAV6RQF5_SOLSE|nr:myosin phosphatase Rho-interacting protein isoform X4 [Solea senegalensis]KAG7507656.1 hypothetical protein JOB18_040953 [Solea senegalensis]